MLHSRVWVATCCSLALTCSILVVTSTLATPLPDKGARTAKDREVSASNVKKIVLAMQSYTSVYDDKLPPAAIREKDPNPLEGKPLLSWRVLLLPFLDEDRLYREFKLDEPWDSEHNKKLVEKMPYVFSSPGIAVSHPHLTHYRVFVGKDTLFPHRNLASAYAIHNIPDGNANTIFVVEAGEAVAWTKPDELVFGKTLPRLGVASEESFLVGLMDGKTRWVNRKVSEKTLRNAICPTDAQPLGIDW